MHQQPAIPPSASGAHCRTLRRPPPPARCATAVPIDHCVGQTKEQVTAAFGQPLKVGEDWTEGVIFYYKDMKVTFTNGKVSNVE
jgi:hypothetical protein